MFTPAIDAVHVAIIDSDRHLTALVGLDTIELLLITDTLVTDGFLGPGTELDSTVITDDCIMLLFKELSVSVFDHCTVWW